MDVVGEGARAAASAAAGAGGSAGFIQSVVGFSAASTPLLFWLLTVALVAAIHVASAYMSPSSSSSSSPSDDERKTETTRPRRRGFAAGAVEEEADRHDDRVLQMMRSFSFVHASEEDFVDGMATYGRAFDDAPAPPETLVARPAPAPDSPPSLSFSFRNQVPEIPPETAVVPSRAPPVQVEQPKEKESPIPFVTAAKHETVETEVLMEEEEEEEEHQQEAVEAEPKIVPVTHNYRFLTERDFRGFVKEPETMTVRVQESFAPPPPPPAAAAQPEERRVVDAASRRGGFVATSDFQLQPAIKPVARDTVATPRTRAPSRRRRPARSPSAASRGSAVSGGRASFASGFSGFGGDSDSESSASDDGYSVRDLVVDSDSDWFVSEKDFPAAAAHDASLRGYRAMESVAEADALERSFRDSAPAVSPASLAHASPDSVKCPADMWSRSPSPDAEYKEDEEKLPRQDGEDRGSCIDMSDDDDDDWDERSSGSKKMIAAAPVYDADSGAEDSLEHSEKEIITINDHSYEAVSDAKSSPEAATDRELVVSSHQGLHDTRRSPAPSERELDHSSEREESGSTDDQSKESVSDGKRSPQHSVHGFVGTAGHSHELVSDVWKEIAGGEEEAGEVAYDFKRSPKHSEHGFAGTEGHSHEFISDVWKGIAGGEEEAGEVAYDFQRSPQHSEHGFVSTEGHSHELISDVWKGIAGGEEEAGEVAYDFKRRPGPSEKEFVSTNAHSSEFDSDDRKAIVHANDQSYAVGSDGHSIPEQSEQEFGENNHTYGVITDGNSISDLVEDNKHASADDHPGKDPRHVHFSVTEKAKSLDEEDDLEGKRKDLTEEEEDELESLWEHQDLIEQLKLELKKVRSVGLPTILEESESPKAPMEDLKPWRIDAKFLREDPMDELNKFFKSYRERMRKFDILCYQKMYAIDFLQLRGPQQSSNSVKTMSPTVASILSHNFRSSRRRSPEDSSERFLKELRYDLETVYVGQMCLSWEFLRWQYEQARDLPESDPYHSHQYNQVAGEFQQFQVVVQRFVEDESFKGPRLPNYINNRCVLRSLLQVPVIKEDSLKDRMEDQRKGNFVITSEELEYVMEESMHILWEFIKADRAETPATSVLKGLSSPHVELQDPLDHDLMMHIHATLQKKEKRLKDLLRTGNCIVKKFKKPKEDRSNQNLFFSQVDMRLVARVLRMPRITSEQLQWCRAKLDKIILVENRRIHREAAFLLFPC
ncbi:hypothetical protein ACQ4PT_063381 [Festuca glaucescens]